VHLVQRALAPVNPAKAQCHLNRLRIGDGLCAAALLGKLHPDPRRSNVLIRQPLFPRHRGGKGHNRQSIRSYMLTRILHTVDYKLTEWRS
jgi:hypothetical protein